MNKEMKVKMLKSIGSGKLPASALHIETGVYLKTTKPGTYKHNNNHLITYNEVTRLIKSDCFYVCCMFTNDNQYPDSVTISNYIEGRDNYIEFRTETPKFQTL